MILIYTILALLTEALAIGLFVVIVTSLVRNYRTRSYIKDDIFMRRYRLGLKIHLVKLGRHEVNQHLLDTLKLNYFS